MSDQPVPEIQRYQPPDVDYAIEKLDAACGHCALAAVLGIPVADAVRHLGKPGWLNIPMMQRGIEKAGYGWTRHNKCSTPKDPTGREEARGVVMIQFGGPWTAPGKPPALAARYRHWVAWDRGLIWDVNTEVWEVEQAWVAHVIESFKEEIPGMTGFSVSGFYEIHKTSAAVTPSVAPAPRPALPLQGDLFGVGGAPC